MECVISEKGKLHGITVVSVMPSLCTLFTSLHTDW